MRDARWDAESWTDEKFATHIPDKWRGNAFKHMVWNAQGVKKMIWQGYSQWTAYDLTKQFTTAHERDPNVNNGNLDPNNIDTAMDLHNNAQGRSYMKNNISWGVFGLRSMPSESSIKNDMANHCNDDVNQIRYLTSASAILALTYGDVNALADANYVSYPNAVRIQ